MGRSKIMSTQMILSWCPGKSPCDPCKPKPPPSQCQGLFGNTPARYFNQFTYSYPVGQAVANWIKANGIAPRNCSPSMIIGLGDAQYLADGTSIGGDGVMIGWPLTAYGNIGGTPNPSSINATFSMGFGSPLGLYTVSGTILGIIVGNFYKGTIKSGLPNNTFIYLGPVPTDPSITLLAQLNTAQSDATWGGPPPGVTVYV